MVKCVNKGCRKHTEKGERECVKCITKRMEWEAHRDDVIATVINITIGMIENDDDYIKGYIADYKAGKLNGCEITSLELTLSHDDFKNMIPNTDTYMRTKRVYDKIVMGIKGAQPWIGMAVHQLAKTY